MTKYVAGFLFSLDRTEVVLINKLRPAWQAGLLNGVGGRIQDGETPYEAMVREFEEEAGLHRDNWKHFCTLEGVDWQVDFFKSFGVMGDLKNAVHSVTDEKIEIVGTDMIARLQRVVSNLRWLIPLALEEEIILASQL